MYSVFKLVFSLLTGASIRTGNFAAYRGWLARNVLFHPHFDNCYSSSLISLNVAVQLVPCERGTRYAGQSRMSFLKLVMQDRKSTRLNSSHLVISYAVFCLKK